MAVVGLASAFSDVHVCSKGLHFQNDLTKGKLFQNHMPHLFFFSAVFPLGQPKMILCLGDPVSRPCTFKEILQEGKKVLFCF